MTKTNASWKIHTPNLLNEVLKNPGTGILKKPLTILGRYLYLIGERATELDDPILNNLMCKLTIYEIADPQNTNYDLEKLKEVENLAKEAILRKPKGEN